MRRVAITGAGTVNPLGASLAQTLDGLRAGACGIGALDMQDLDRLSVRIGAPVRGWSPGAPPGVAALCDRSALMALDAAAEAAAMAGLALSGAAALSAGVIMGTAGGGHMAAEAAYRAVFAEGRGRVHPFTVPRLMANSAAGQIAIAQGLKGPSLTVSTACASSNHAIGLAFQMVASGQAEVMLAGGAEAMLDFGGIKVWEALRVLSPTGCHPFAAGRSGMVLGEGAAVFVLEPMEAALRRGAPVLAEIAGFGMTSDAANMITPRAEGAVRAMRAALAGAGLAPAEIGYVNAHGTGTQANDLAEASALAEVFGPSGVPVSATKSAHGHLIGGAGAVELLACLLALTEGLIAPTVGGQPADPALGVDLVTGAARRAEVRACLSNSFAFGGQNAVLCLRRAQPGPLAAETAAKAAVNPLSEMLTEIR
ncbi:MAG: beta-ketoacyl-[acyl-carrier-protein] synthase family protein [Paracoccaceae bacterium]